MKVLNIIPYFGAEFGGPPVNVLNISAHLIARQIDSCILTTTLNVDNREESIDHYVDHRKARVKIIYTKSKWGKFRYSRQFSDIFSSVAREYDIILIHCLWLFPSSYAAWFCMRNKIKYFIFTHAMLSKYSYSQKPIRKYLYYNLIEKKNLQAASGVFFMDENERAFASSIGYRGNGLLLSNALNEEDVSTADDLNKFKTMPLMDTAAPVRVLFLGRIHPKKGLHFLVDAFIQLRRSRQNIKLLIAGPPQDLGYYNKIRSKTQELERLGSVVYLGSVVGDEKRRLFHSADIFVLPSHDDSRPLALLEAMGSGLPVIASLGCKMPEIHERMGYLVGLSSSDIQLALSKLVEDGKLRLRMGQAGQQHIHENYMWKDRIVEIMNAIGCCQSSTQ